jgi:ubiquinone/menaquinone biosynthesis C-methylase UbiE
MNAEQNRLEDQRQFWSRVAQNYDGGVDATIGPRTRPMLRERVGKEGRLGRLVEFGCGTGFHTDTLAAKADQVVATDLAPGMLDVARSRVRAGNITFEIQDIQQTSLPDASFDTSFVGMVIHFTDPRRTLAEMHRVLKPGGRLILLNPDPKALGWFDGIRARVRMIFQGITRWRVKPPKDFAHMLGERELCDLIQAAGFSDVQAESFKDESRSSYIPVEYIRAVKC